MLISFKMYGLFGPFSVKEKAVDYKINFILGVMILHYPSKYNSKFMFTMCPFW